jgi:hypothetical protein
MKEKDVEALATLLNKTPDELGTVIENGGVDELLTEFKTKHSIMPTTDFDKFKQNFQDQLVEKWTTDQAPKPIYDKIKGGVLQMKEKEIAKEFAIDDYSDFNDLVHKIVESKAKNPEDVTKLKSRITELETTHNDALKSLQRQNDQRYVDFRLAEVINGIDIDAEGVMLENQRRILKTMAQSEFGYLVKDGQVLVTKNGEPVTDSKLDPIPLSNVIRDYAKDIVKLKSPDGGGRGEGSSASSFRPKSINVMEYLEKNNIPVNSGEHAKLVREWTKEGIELI